MRHDSRPGCALRRQVREDLAGVEHNRQARRGADDAALEGAFGELDRHQPVEHAPGAVDEVLSPGALGAGEQRRNDVAGGLGIGRRPAGDRAVVARHPAIGRRRCVLRALEPGEAFRDEPFGAGIGVAAGTPAVGRRDRPRRRRQGRRRTATQAGQEIYGGAQRCARPKTRRRACNRPAVANHHGIGSARRQSASYRRTPGGKRRAIACRRHDQRSIRPATQAAPSAGSTASSRLRPSSPQ